MKQLSLHVFIQLVVQKLTSFFIGLGVIAMLFTEAPTVIFAVTSTVAFTTAPAAAAAAVTVAVTSSRSFI